MIPDNRVSHRGLQTALATALLFYVLLGLGLWAFMPDPCRRNERGVLVDPVACAPHAIDAHREQTQRVLEQP